MHQTKLIRMVSVIPTVSEPDATLTTPSAVPNNPIKILDDIYVQLMGPRRSGRVRTELETRKTKDRSMRLLNPSKIPVRRSKKVKVSSPQFYDQVPELTPIWRDT